MEKGIEELLKPRYKVIADYPGRRETMPIGHILILESFNNGRYWHEFTEVEPIHIDEGFAKYPHLFKRLEWWEERKPEEMPQYVKLGKRLIKVKQWAFDTVRTDVLFYNWEGDDTGAYVDYQPYTQPATEQEYLNSLPNKQNK